MIKRVLLVYSGRMVDKIALHWLKNKMKMSVFTYTAQVGGEDITPETAGEDAMQLGVESAYFGELKEKFYKYMLVNAIRCNIRGNNGSFLIKALSRPVMVKEMTEIALENNCKSIAFCAESFSIDQLRYNNLIASVSPDINLILPQAEWPMRTYQDMLKYALKHNLAGDRNHRKEFSIEKNLWGSHIKCGRIEDLWKDTPDELYPEILKIENAPDKPRYVEVEFNNGIPIKLNNKEMDGVSILNELNVVGMKNGIGRRDLIEEELLGIKTRIIQEAPGAHIVCTAHKALEDITLSSQILDIQADLSLTLTRVVHEGKWFTDLREAVCGFFRTIQRNVTGAIRLKLYKGNCIVMRRKARSPLYKRDLITVKEKGTFPAADIEKFLNVWTHSKRGERDISSTNL